ncbi:MAG: tRNA (N6-isopentenyl adenosine(37)-C2)-methylthiotransferase MiaB [Caldisericia bacterium]|nr:tRNA (N6-isopentenyl adenosine(37)-C2)-methylthiotransferase MiaB [Caldisericia bacterium]
MPLGYHIHTLGCQMNKSDSELYSSVLEDAGYNLATPETADIIFINTCAVREASVHKMESKIGEWIAMRNKTGKPKKIGVIGCIPAVDIAEFKKKHRNIDFVLGTYPDKDSMKTALISTLGLHINRNIIPKSSISAFVPITSGCNCFCTYYIVPYTRGRLISRTESEVINDIKNKLSTGAVEIILLGQNVNEYNLDHGDKLGFVKLLEKVDRIDGLKRLRFITSHPKDMNDETIERMANLKNLAPYFHLPVQAGSDEILRRMARGYTRSQYLHLVNKIREHFPVSAITTDVIVGFPGETIAQFEDTLSLMDEVKFDQLFCAMYSPRPKTPAGNLPGRCDKEELHRRINTVLAKQREIGSKITKSYLDKESKVLIQNHVDNTTVGMNERGRFIDIEGIHPIGEILNVKITSVDGRLKGKVIS